jgi:hypothetical protein
VHPGKSSGHIGCRANLEETLPRDQVPLHLDHFFKKFKAETTLGREGLDGGSLALFALFKQPDLTPRPPIKLKPSRAALKAA